EHEDADQRGAHRAVDGVARLRAHSDAPSARASVVAGRRQASSSAMIQRKATPLPMLPMLIQVSGCEASHCSRYVDATEVTTPSPTPPASARVNDSSRPVSAAANAWITSRVR